MIGKHSDVYMDVSDVFRILYEGLLVVGDQGAKEFCNNIFPFFLIFLAHRARVSPVKKFGAKVGLEVHTNTNWKPFCHPTWDINLANEVCKAYGFPKADATADDAYSGHNDSCAVTLKSNKTTCDGLNIDMLPRCDNVNRTGAVCKGTHYRIRLLDYCIMHALPGI